MKGVLENIQHYCIHDGPGIRTVVFLKGWPPALPLVLQPHHAGAQARTAVPCG